jgi:hypothetical protein
VQINKVKLELVRNKEKLPNIIHAFGTDHSTEDFLTWKLQYAGSPRYCYGCGQTDHEVRRCPKGRTRKDLESVTSVVGEEREESVGDVPLQDSYAAVVKHRAFMDKQSRERVAEENKVRQEAAERFAKEDDARIQEENVRLEEENVQRVQKEIQEEKQLTEGKKQATEKQDKENEKQEFVAQKQKSWSEEVAAVQGEVVKDKLTTGVEVVAPALQKPQGLGWHQTKKELILEGK